MSAHNVITHPSADPEKTWPGHATIDATGAAIARDMLSELASFDEEGNGIGYFAALENSYREGRPLRNVVAEYAAKAQSVGGAKALAGFYAVISDYIGRCCQGLVPDAEYYDRYCEEAPR